jgi:hypothetical protein
MIQSLLGDGVPPYPMEYQYLTSKSHAQEGKVYCPHIYFVMPNGINQSTVLKFWISETQLVREKQILRIKHPPTPINPRGSIADYSFSSYHEPNATPSVISYLISDTLYHDPHWGLYRCKVIREVEPDPWGWAPHWSTTKTFEGEFGDRSTTVGDGALPLWNIAPTWISDRFSLNNFSQLSTNQLEVLRKARADSDRPILENLETALQI